jgi:4-alpha-glucanotransferase
LKPDRNLQQLAKLWGIQTSYLDMSKQRRDADPEAMMMVLRAMGAGVDGPDDIKDALARRKKELELREQNVEPVMVAWDGKLGSRRFEFGYHDVEIKGRHTFVISAPSQAYRFPNENGAWGIFAPLYALHSKRNPGAGDLTDFENLMDWMHGLGGSVAATLPLLGAFLSEPFEPSPYSPASRLFWNEFYVDLHRVPEFEGYSWKGGPRTEYVNYGAVMAEKRTILEKMSRKFFSNAPAQRRSQFTKFLRENKEVEQYARFRAVTDRQRQGWQSWPDRLRDGTIRESDYDEHAKNYHLYAQWIVQEQLLALSKKAAARGQVLYLDLPLGINPAGYDIWQNRDFFVQRAAGGAPPDPVFTRGQNWGFPPMNPEAMRLNRYQYVIAYLRNHFRYAKLVRIDHVMGLHRLYWIPEGLPGDKGVYVNYPAEELWAILCLESHRYRAGIVGENLGTVPPAVNSAMKLHDITEMYIVQYEIMADPDEPYLRRPPQNSVASLNTHDMPPFRAFLDGADIEDRLDLGFLDEKTARKERRQRGPMRRKLGTFREAIQFLSNSMANIVLVNAEDLWEETLSQNVPATSAERPNWRRRFRPSIEQLRTMAGIAEVLSNVFAERSRSLPV